MWSWITTCITRQPTSSARVSIELDITSALEPTTLGPATYDALFK